MNDKIKEILECLKTVNDNDVVWPVYQHEAKILLDYITNLQEENKHLDEVNCHLRKKINNDDFDETMKDIKDNLIARINRQDCEIHNLQQRIDKAIEYIEEKGRLKYKPDELLNILKGNKWNEVERAYLDDKPIGSDKE